MLLGRSCRQHSTHLIGGIAEWVLQARRASRSRHTGRDRILGCKMHMRFAFIDGRYLVLRSMNWTSAGRGQYSLLVNARGLARQFGRYYEAIWHSIPRKWQEAGAHLIPNRLSMALPAQTAWTTILTTVQMSATPGAQPALHPGATPSGCTQATLHGNQGSLPAPTLNGMRSQLVCLNLLANHSPLQRIANPQYCAPWLRSTESGLRCQWHRVRRIGVPG